MHELHRLANKHESEGDLLMARLAADSGARRSELVVLRFDDLEGRVLRIQRAVSAESIETPISGNGRTLTLGSATTQLWQLHQRNARERVGLEPGLWVFSSDLAHHERVRADALGHRLVRLRGRAGVPDASLHQLRHSVAVFLVAQGEIRHAQRRLAHADASTTLREYAYVLPLQDSAIADAIDQRRDTQDTYDSTVARSCGGP